MDMIEYEKALIGWVFCLLYAMANNIPSWICYILTAQVIICIIAIIIKYKQNGT